MRHLAAAIIALAMLIPASPGLAKVCYRCKDNKPVPYVCAKADTFKARKNARAVGCHWTATTSTCKCGKWVKTRSTLTPFVRWALTHL